MVRSVAQVALVVAVIICREKLPAGGEEERADTDQEKEGIHHAGDFSPIRFDTVRERKSWITKTERLKESILQAQGTGSPTH